MHHTKTLLPLFFVAVAINAVCGQEPAPAIAAGGTTRLAYASKELIGRQQPPLDCSYRTLDRRLRHADFSMIIEIRRQADAENDVPKKVQVRQVIKPSNVATIAEDDLLQIPLDGHEHKKTFALVFCAFDPSRRLGITEIQWMGKDEVDYFSKLAGFAADESRVWYLLETEASGNPPVSFDARAELEALPAADITRAAGERLREFVLQRLAAPTLDSSQRHFYLMLLGHAGQAEDVNVLAQYIFPDPASSSSYLWTAAEAYLRLGDEAARRRFVEHFFTESLPRTRSEAERTAQARRLLPPYLAMLEVAPELDKQAKAGEYLIKYSVLADLVLSNALRMGDTRFVSLAIDTYHREGVDPLLQSEAVVYAAGMLEHEKAHGDREKIEQFLALVRSREPKLYERAWASLERRRTLFQWTQ